MVKVEISIIVPVYNAHNYIEKCLTSLLIQKINSYEIICIDDGSTDNSLMILEEFKSQNPDIVKVLHTNNRGTWRARKLGIELAQGKYIGFCDSDDFVVDDMYLKLYNAAENNGAQMVVCAFRRVDAVNGKEYSIEMNDFGYDVLDVNRDIGALAVINTSLWNKLYLAEVVKQAIDYELPPRIAEDTVLTASLYPTINKIAFVRKPLYNYTVHSYSTIKNIEQADIELTKEALCVLKQYMVNNKLEDKYLILLDLMAFIHIGIALPILSIANVEYKQMKKFNNEIRKYLTHYFPSWKNNQYLKLDYIVKHNKHLLRPKIMQIIYQLRMFTFFLRIYGVMMRKFKIEKRW